MTNSAHTMARPRSLGNACAVLLFAAHALVVLQHTHGHQAAAVRVGNFSTRVTKNITYGYGLTCTGSRPGRVSQLGKPLEFPLYCMHTSTTTTLCGLVPSA